MLYEGFFGWRGKCRSTEYDLVEDASALPTRDVLNGSSQDREIGKI